MLRCIGKGKPYPHAFVKKNKKLELMVQEEDVSGLSLKNRDTANFEVFTRKGVQMKYDGFQ